MQTALNVGVDVASKTVVVACAAGTFAPRTLANARGPLGAWLQTLPRGSRLGLESTGSYHQLLADLASAAGLTVYVVNARDLKHYAAGVGRRGKTDRVDAQVLARYIAHEHEQLHAYVPRSAAQIRLEQLLKRRGKLVAGQVRLQQGWRGVGGVQAELRAVVVAYARLLTRVDQLVAQALAALPQTQARARHVGTIPGYGALGSVTLAHALTRLPFTNVDAFIAYTGLDPRPHDSGAKHGRRRLSKRGPAELRRVLHVCAMAATRSNVWRPYYLAQRAKGLSGTAALVVLARKMARTAYGLCQNQTPFDPSRIFANT